ncbi:MAG: copper oxidase (laccase) domain-containing protein [Francisella sp.]|jgi:copper oxidase (laccase) domain-containing protein
MSVVFINTPFIGLKLGYTNNTQGFSKGSFSKLNLSDNVRDNPLVVDKNRNLFKSYISADIKWLNQNHTNTLKSFEECDTEQCDAVFTDKLILKHLDRKEMINIFSI